MSSTEIARLLEQAEQSFDAPPDEIEAGLAVQDSTPSVAQSLSVAGKCGPTARTR